MKKVFLSIFTLIIGVVFLTGCFSSSVEVKFNTNGGNVIESITIKKDGNFLIPNEPTKEGYIFKGWFIDDKFIKEFNGLKPTKDITLYAKWEAYGTSNYEISFDSKGGGNVEKQSVKGGEKAIEPKNPKLDGFRFGGWYVGDKLFDFNTLITKDIVLVAKWMQLEDLFNYTEPKEVTFTQKARKLVYDFLVLIEDENVGIYDIEEGFKPYDYDNIDIQYYIDRISEIIKYGRITEVELETLISLIEQEKIVVLEFTDKIELIKYVIGDLITNGLKELDQDVVGKALYGLTLFVLDFQIESLERLISFPGDNYNNYIQLNQLKLIRKEIIEMGHKNIFIATRLAFMIRDSFINNNGLDFIELLDNQELTDEEIFEIIQIFSNTINGIGLSNEGWEYLLNLPVTDNFKSSLEAALVNIKDPMLKDFLVILIEAEYQVFTENFKYFIDLIVKYAKSIKLEDIKQMNNAYEFKIDNTGYYIFENGEYKAITYEEYLTFIAKSDVLQQQTFIRLFTQLPQEELIKLEEVVNEFLSVADAKIKEYLKMGMTYEPEEIVTFNDLINVLVEIQNYDINKIESQQDFNGLFADLGYKGMIYLMIKAPNLFTFISNAA